MCGILGITCVKGRKISHSQITKALFDLYVLSEIRGKEASGIAVKQGAEIDIIKSPVPATEFIKSNEYKHLIFSLKSSESLSAIGHSRLATNGQQSDNNNNQPVLFNDTACVHNGIIVNTEEIYSRHPQLKTNSDLDSISAAGLIDQSLKKGNAFEEAMINMMHTIEGTVNIAVLHKQRDVMNLASNNGSIYYLHNEAEKIFIFSSESFLLKEFLKRGNFTHLFEHEHITHLPAREGIEVDLTSYNVTKYKFELDHSEKVKSKNKCFISVEDLANSKESSTNPEKLKRCSKCVLPETMPFIDFDEKGICNYCKNYNPMQVKGYDAFDRELSKFRGNGKNPDCIVTLSGGRDSSYCLHKLKKDFGMNPLALTYDWGMVTPLARRNQARMTGKLGVEHILISADISKKREYIRQNVTAWLKKPDLGMVPIFMAGDKHFFYYFNKARKQYNLDLVTLSVNPLEKTDFKTGFCGVEYKPNEYYFESSLVNRLGLLSYYARQLLGNRSYLNSSLFDSAKAFLSSFFISHDYINIFDYIRWDEDEVNETLINNYNWEMDSDSESTWRIGDGTAPFYNYIYYKIAGFSENDTFRSNQVREGVITRDQALKLVDFDNTPREKPIKEYLELIGLDFDSTMEKIDRIPPLLIR